LHIGQPDSHNSKIPVKSIWNPKDSLVETVPNEIVLGSGKPAVMEVAHWHAQIEICYVQEGFARYEMSNRMFEIHAGQVAVFWGGLPHRLVDFTTSTTLESIHLPILQFFRLRLTDDIREKLMHGAVLLTTESIIEDRHAFARWCDYFRSGDPQRISHATEELLLRIERISLEAYELIDVADPGEAPLEAPDQSSFEKIRLITEFVTSHFREEIDAASIAECAKIHPKYAMSVFKKSTGVTLNHYVQLLRLSYAQALLMREDGNILTIAMESGFGSLSNFNRAFRKHTGVTPSDYKRQLRLRSR